jgi:RNA polymerase sigma factor (sigma-70 family)
MNTLLDYPTFTDRRLVELYLDGDRDAFRQIVERYQAMVCALGLSACGDIGRSEDIAQEVFVVAWRRLPELREPEKLRAWLAGIARNLIHNAFRRQRRTPFATAEELSPETPAEVQSPRDHAISRDESALMWSAIEGIPEIYRETMVLFYREQRSVPAVAQAQEISEEVVRQRLVRGRALLSERMAKLVEETLERSAPTSAFAGAMLMAMPVGGATAAVVAEVGVAGTKAATGGLASKAASAAGVAGMAAAKSGLAVKALAIVGLVPALFGGLLEFLRFRTNYEGSESPARRRQIALAHLSPKLLFGLFVVGFWVLDIFRRSFGVRLGPWVPIQLVFMLALVLLASVWLRRWRRRTDETSALTEYKVSNTAAVPGEKAFEYRSRRVFLGLPLLHIYVGGPKPVMKRSARGWVAVSDGIALGGILAAGGQMAVAPVCLGPVAVGLLSAGVLSLGLVAVGAVVGGVFVYGGVAFGLKAAQGGLAISRGYSMGIQAFGPHANDAVASHYFQNHHFYRIAETSTGVVSVTLWFMWLPSLLLIGWYLWRKRAAR